MGSLTRTVHSYGESPLVIDPKWKQALFPKKVKQRLCGSLHRCFLSFRDDSLFALYTFATPPPRGDTFYYHTHWTKDKDSFCSLYEPLTVGTNKVFIDQRMQRKVKGDFVAPSKQKHQQCLLHSFIYLLLFFNESNNVYLSHHNRRSTIDVQRCWAV